MVSKLMRKLGIVKTTFLITGISVVFSVALYLIISMVSGDILIKGIIISIIIPAIVAPLLSYHFLRAWLQLKISEKELLESEARFKELAELLPETVYEMDVKGNVTFVNRNAFDHFGYTQPDFDRGLNAFDMLDSKDRNRAMENVERILRGEKVGLAEYTALRKDGTTFPAMFHSTAIIREEKPVGLRGFIIDITARRKAEELLRFKNIILSTQQETSLDGILVVDEHGEMISFNKRFVDMWGLPPDVMESKSDERALQWVLDKLREPEEFLSRVNSLYRHRKDKSHEEVSLSDGRTFERYSAPMFGTDKKYYGRVWYFRDITKRKHMEEEQRKLTAQLERTRRLDAVGTLAGGVAHDLNNILSGVVSYPELLLMDLPDDSPLKKPIQTIKKSGEKAAAIVQDLLTLARRGIPVTEVVNLNNIITEYLESPEYEKLKLYHPTVQVETDLETDLLNIAGSPVHLSNTIMNLISNASEAMPNGGDISISAKNQYNDKPIRGYDHVAEGDYVVLSVSDNGVGISPEHTERIFEPFYTKKAMGRSGTGLGMAVVWGTIKDHKGYIDVQSTEGKGTTFTLYLPVTRKEAAGDKPMMRTEGYMGKGESILIVDDVEEQREIASGILNKLGYSVTSVSSGEEAVAYLKKHTTDLIVLDMIMAPGIDGLETYRRILESHPKQKAIIASGFSETERVKEAKRLGAGAYVRKPYVLQKIGIAVRNELDQAGFSKPPKTEKNNAMISA